MVYGVLDVSVNQWISTCPRFARSGAMLVFFQEPGAEVAVPTHEDLKQGSSNPGTAEDAEAEAIRSGLQVIYLLSASIYYLSYYSLHDTLAFAKFLLISLRS